MKTALISLGWTSFALAAALSTGCEASTHEPAASQGSTPGALPGLTPVEKAPRLNATTYFAHGHLLERQGDFERAVVQFEKALEVMPDFIAARNRLGITLNKLGRHDRASAEFARAIAAGPKQAYLHNNLGFSRYLEGKYTLAEEALAHALTLRPDYPRARMNHGIVLAKLGRYDEALGEFRRAGPECDAYYNLAMIQTEAGRFAEAAQALDAALRLNPRLEPARLQLREVARLAAEQESRRAAAPAQDHPQPGPGTSLRPDVALTAGAEVAHGAGSVSASREKPPVPSAAPPAADPTLTLTETPSMPGEADAPYAPSAFAAAEPAAASEAPCPDGFGEVVVVQRPSRASGGEAEGLLHAPDSWTVAVLFDDELGPERHYAGAELLDWFRRIDLEDWRPRRATSLITGETFEVEPGSRIPAGEHAPAGPTAAPAPIEVRPGDTQLAVLRALIDAVLEQAQGGGEALCELIRYLDVVTGAPAAED